MTNETAREAAANQKHLVDLLRREAAHSGVWFASHLDTAANLIERDLLAGQSVGDITRDAIDAASAEIDRLSRELDITNADHIALWLEANAISLPLTHQLSWVACRIAEAHEAARAPKAVDRDEIIPAGMKPWHGGDNAPEDWDKLGPIKCRGGGVSDPGDNGPWYWEHDAEDSDIIAYTPLSSPSPDRDERTSIEREVERLKAENARLSRAVDFINSLHNQGATDVG